MAVNSQPSAASRSTAKRRGSRYLVRAALVTIFAWVAFKFVEGINAARHAAMASSCQGHVGQLCLGLRNYESVHGRLPPAYTTDANGNRLHSWRTLILPYMEQHQLYESIDLTKPWDDPINAAACNTSPHGLVCPALASNIAATNLTTYLAVVTPESAIRAGESAATEGLAAQSETLLIIDATPDKAVPWMSPYDADEQLLLQFDRDSPSQHAGDIMLAGFADGRARFLTPDLSADARRALITVSADDNAAIPER